VSWAKCWCCTACGWGPRPPNEGNRRYGPAEQRTKLKQAHVPKPLELPHDAGMHVLPGQPDLRTEIDRLRTKTRPGAAQLPARQRASDASLRRRLEAANGRIRGLAKENRKLCDQLAAVLGELRSHRQGR
jgi:hypothetical protein